MSTDEKPATPAYCSWHDGYDTTARLIHVIEQGTSPGIGMSACDPCRDQHELVPLADQERSDAP